MNATRQQRLDEALCRGASLTLENSGYRQTVRSLLDELVRTDFAGGDLTAKAVGITSRDVSAAIQTREGGVAAGLDEFAFFLRTHGLEVSLEKADGAAIGSGEILLRAEGPEQKLLLLERVGLNLLQRLSGIATASRCLQQRVSEHHPGTRVVGTRKTPWGLLDKRALHLGSGGTHRLGLGDAILIKNNHLALLGCREEEAAPLAIEKAWEFRAESAFIEVEVRGEKAARTSAQAFRRLQEAASEWYPCLLMLDNTTPDQTAAIIHMLRQENLWEHTFIEASGRISESNVVAYAVSGVDAISVGALTHSPRALDLCQRIL
jgi:nicotinate-nucleotide pyrophosphorylase (carboxylating)